MIGTHGLGHARLATESSVLPNASHPFWARPFSDVAIVHNGQITDYFTWRDKLQDRKLVQNLQREIHTFKGGARMAGLEGMGSMAHAMESLLELIADRRLEATVAAVQALVS